MIRKFLLLCLVVFSTNGFAQTWCTIENFRVAVAQGKYVAVHRSSLSEDGSFVYLGDITTDYGRAIHTLLLTAAVSNKRVLYGNNSQNFTCGQFPAYSEETLHPEYLSILTDE